MRVAIVGHDKTLPGRGLGAEIDSCDLVVKMLNCGWHDSVDYGKRYDFAIATKSSFVLDSVKMPKIAIWCYEKHGRELFHHLGADAQDITPLIRHSITDLLPKFAGREVPVGISRGCAAVLGVIAVLIPRKIMLYGMGQLASGVRQEDRHPDIYREHLTTEQKSVLPADKDHNWQAEHKLIHYVAKLNKCELLTNTDA